MNKHSGDEYLMRQVSWILIGRYLYAAPTGLLEEDILRLQVAVDDGVSVQQLQTLEDGIGKLPHQLQTEPLK